MSFPGNSSLSNQLVASFDNCCCFFVQDYSERYQGDSAQENRFRKVTRLCICICVYTNNFAVMLSIAQVHIPRAELQCKFSLLFVNLDELHVVLHAMENLTPEQKNQLEISQVSTEDVFHMHAMAPGEVCLYPYSSSGVSCRNYMTWITLIWQQMVW